MQRIIYDKTGQTLRHVPPARVESATYVLEDLSRSDTDADRILGSGSATVPTWTVTSTAAAGRGTASPARITAATTTGATVGAPAAITSPDGAAEIFEVATVSANAYVEAEAWLAGAYPVGSTVRGVELSAPVPDVLAADEDILEQRRPLRIVWTYTLGGRTVLAQDLVAFVRHTHAATVDVGAAILRVRERYPDLADRLPPRASLDRLAASLVEDVEDDLRQRKVEPERFLLGPAGARLLELRIVAHAGDLGYAPGNTPTDGRWARVAADRYRERLEALLLGEPGSQTLVTSLVTDQAPTGPDQTYRGPTLRM